MRSVNLKVSDSRIRKENINNSNTWTYTYRPCFELMYPYCRLLNCCLSCVFECYKANIL